MNYKKDLAIIFGLFLVIAFLMFFARGFTSVGFLFDLDNSQSTQEGTPSSQLIPPRSAGTSEDFTQISIQTFKVNAEIANTNDKKREGLSKRESLSISEGMLFTYDKSAIYTFWMKDVEFPIDIIWISSNKKIVDIAQNAQPEPDKDDDELKRYRPRGDAQFILEINAGLSSAHNLRIGDPVNFDL